MKKKNVQNNCVDMSSLSEILCIDVDLTGKCIILIIVRLTEETTSRSSDLCNLFKKE